MAAIRPATDGQNALEAGGILALRISESCFPIFSKYSLLAIVGLSVENTTGTFPRTLSFFSFVLITFAKGQTVVLLISAIISDMNFYN